MKHFDFNVTVRGREFQVSGDISPAEPSTWSEWDGGTQGCPACVEDASIHLVRGQRRRQVSEHRDPTKEQEKAWSDFYCEIESAVFEALADVLE